MAKKKKTAVNRKVRRSKPGTKREHYAQSSYRRAFQTPGRGLHTNPGVRLRKVGARGTGWIAARRVKIVKRRGHPAQVLVERPRKRSKKGR